MSGVVIGGVLFDPQHCVESTKVDVTHKCVHDWRVEWGNLDREYQEPMG